MNKALKILALFLLLLSNLPAQDLTGKVSNFSGTWILDKEKSRFDILDDEDGYTNYILKIADDEKEFKINKSYVYKGKQINYEIVLFTDKRGETNVISIPGDSWKVESKTNRKTNVVNRNYKYKIVNKDLTTRYSGSEKYSLSEDGKKLTLVVSNSFKSYAGYQIRVISGPRIHKLVFDKK